MFIDYFHKISEKYITELNSLGYSNPGHNGPYRDPETPVRNTAHILFLLSKLAYFSKDSLIINAANKACDYLCSQSARPKNTIFYCRTNPKKDFSNGLMGQAWAIEGLIAAGNLLGRSDALKIAKECYFLHPWLEDQALWCRVAMDGSSLTYDGTFNHQLWFAAISAYLDDSEITRRSERFLDHVAQHVQVYKDGVIFHQSRLGTLSNSLKNSSSFFIKNLWIELSRINARRSQYSKSVGYHGFNLYAFALLKKIFPDHKFWSSFKFKKILDVTRSKVFLTSLETSDYGWPYNPPGIEFAFAGEVFGMGHDYCQSWIDLQYSKTFNLKTGDFLTRNVPDPLTSAARIYEAIRLEGKYILKDNIK
jgi:hypothetical protein